MADKPTGDDNAFADFINSHADIVGGIIVGLAAIALIVSIITGII